MKVSRKAELSGMAYELGMDFDPKPSFPDIKLLSAFKLFKHGHSKKITNQFQRSDEQLESKAQIFDYQYTIQAGNTPVTKRQTVCFIQSKQLELPIFYLRPETWIDRFKQYLGWEDIDFVHYPDFSKKYYLSGEMEELVRELFKDDVLHYFTLKDGWHVEGIGFFLIIYRDGKLLNADSIRVINKIGIDIFQLFK